MSADEAHDIACRALGDDARIRVLLRVHGGALYSSLCPPSDETGGEWIELVQLAVGDATYLDDPRGRFVVLARCTVNAESGQARVSIEGSFAE
jgi:hypothetical protein